MSILVPVLTTLEELFTAGGALGAAGRFGGSLLAGFALSDILNFLKGNPQHKPKVPHFALVDLKNDRVIAFVSRKRAYRMLLRPRGRSRTRTIIVRQSPSETNIIR